MRIQRNSPSSRRDWRKFDWTDSSVGAATYFQINIGLERQVEFFIEILPGSHVFNVL